MNCINCESKEWQIQRLNVVISNLSHDLIVIKDQLHRRNMQIKELKAKLAWITGKTTHKEFINR